MAESTQHTPGPWFIRNTFYNALDIRTSLEGDDDRDLIAQIMRPDQEYIPEGSLEWANARLIAASPDLLTTAVELRNALAAAMRIIAKHELADEFIEHANQSGIPEGVGVRAKEVILRATGEGS